MMAQQDISAHFKTSRKAADPPVGKTRASAQKASAPEPKAPEFSPEETVLRKFDLATKYGPCAGITRLERWERAAKFGMDPPAEVKEILQRLGPDHPSNFDIWHGRV